jgi:type II secretory pathway predicted ATPase ExeA
MANIDRARLNAISLVSTQVEGDDMLRLVAQGLGLNTGAVEKARLLDAVEQQLEADLKAGKRTLLIVDEVQNLPVSALEELRMLSNFQIAGRALIQFVLLGQPEFRDKLAGPGLEQLRQRVIATHHLDAMGADEVAAYVRHRLTLADWQGRPDFDAAAFEAIHRHSGGIPRRVNQIAHRVLLGAAIDNAERIGGQDVEAIAAEMNADAARPAPREEPVLPLRTARSTPVAANEQAPVAPSAPAAPVPDPALERRIAVLEAQLEEQEALLRRTLTLLIDWVESAPEAAYRHHAA